MILNLFLTLLGLSTILIILDYVQRSPLFENLDDYPFIGIMGWFVLFIIGMSVLTTGLYYQSGTSELYQYGNNFTGYHWDYDYSAPPAKPTDAFIFHRNLSNVYTEIQGDFGLFDMSHVLGFFLSALAAGGMTVSWFNMRRGGINENED